LKADEPQVGQRYEAVESKWEYYHIIIFREWALGMMVLSERLRK
jgi:hypothetical protein